MKKECLKQYRLIRLILIVCILCLSFNSTALSNSVSDIMYATYLNTPRENNSANKVFIDSHGNYYIAVSSTSRLLFVCGNTPPGAWITKSSTEEPESHPDYMVNIYKFTSSHDLLWKTMFSSENGLSVEDMTLSEDESFLYVTGEIRTYSDFLPTFTTVYNKDSLSDDKTNVFVVKMDSDGHVHSSVIIGGESWDSPYGICIFNDALYIAGETSSMKFLTTHGERNESTEGFLCSFSLDTLELKTSQYFGGKHSDGIRDIFATKDHLYITGTTSSSSLPGYKETVRSGYSKAFVSCFVPSGEIAWTIFESIGGGTYVHSGSIDSTGNIILCGYTAITRSESFTYLYPPDDDDLYRVGFVSIFTPTGEHISTTGYNKSVFQDVTVSGNSIFATGTAWKGFYRPNEEELPESQSFSSYIQLTSEGKHVKTWVTGRSEKWEGDSGLGIAWNPSKHSIVGAGQTQSKDIPCTDNALQRNPKSSMNAFLIEYQMTE